MKRSVSTVEEVVSDEQLIEAGKLVVGWHRWRWQRGMAFLGTEVHWTPPGRYLGDDGCEMYLAAHPADTQEYYDCPLWDGTTLDGCVPDLSDPVTFGAVLQQLQEALWETEAAPVVAFPPGSLADQWSVAYEGLSAWDIIGEADTREMALARAVVGAP